MVHKGQALASIVPAAVRERDRRASARGHARRKAEGEESLADVAVGAELKLAMGEPLDVLEASLLP
jgi:hypothetical protein